MMQLKLRNDFKMILKVLLFLVLFIFVQNVPVYADAGDLKINNHVIYDKSEGSQSNSATFTINQLFMKDMSEHDKQLDGEKKKLIANAQKEVFVKEIPEHLTVTQEITPFLFSNSYRLNDGNELGESKGTQGNNIGLILLCVVGGLFAVGLGIMLGRVFPTWLKKG